MLWTWLFVLAERYRVASGDPWPTGAAFERVRAHWDRGGKAAMLWLLSEGGNDDGEGGIVRGYAVTELCYGPRGHDCFVTEAYIEPSCRQRGVPLSAMIAFESWAKAHRCRSIKFLTFRSDTAYARLLRRAGYVRGEVTFTKSLEATPHG